MANQNPNMFEKQTPKSKTKKGKIPVPCINTLSSFVSGFKNTDTESKEFSRSSFSRYYFVFLCKSHARKTKQTKAV